MNTIVYRDTPQLSKAAAIMHLTRCTYFYAHTQSAAPATPLHATARAALISRWRRSRATVAAAAHVREECALRGTWHLESRATCSRDVTCASK
jgi:hypothetical protein